MIIFILLLGFFLRLISINQSLWLDEAVNVVWSQKLSFWDFVTKYPIGDFHPPGYFALLWIWDHIFGISEISVRMPSVFLGVATVWLVYLIGKKQWNKNVGLVAAGLMSIAPLHIYYSQEARMYSLATFGVTLSFYFLLRLNYKIKNILGFILGLVLVIYSDYVAYLIIPALILFTFYFQRNKFKLVLLLLGLALIFLLPWLLIFPSQLSQGQLTAQLVPGWKQVVGGHSFKDVILVFVKLIIGRISFDNKLMYGLVVGAISILYGITILPVFKKNNSKKSLILLIWILTPLCLSLLISLFIPILSYFRLLFIAPAIYLLLSVGLASQNPKIKKLLVAFLVSVNLIFTSLYLINPSYHREDWKTTVSFLDSQASSQNVVILEDNEILLPFAYYYRHEIETLPALKNYPARSGQDLVNLAQFLEGKQGIFYVEYLVDVADPQRLVQHQIENLGFVKTQTFNFNGVGFVYLYRKSNTYALDSY